MKKNSQNKWPETQSEIYKLFDRLVVDRELKYIPKNESRYRVLTLFKDPHSNKKVKHFKDSFFASDWKVSGTAFFLENSDGSFRSYLEKGMHKEKRLELSSEENQHLKVLFDKDGLPKVYNLVFTFMHEDSYMLGDLDFTEKFVSTSGKKFILFENKKFFTGEYEKTYSRILFY